MNDEAHEPPRRRWSRRALAVAGLGLPLLPGAVEATIAGERPWHHLPGGGFRNPPGSPERGGSSGDWWSFFYRRLVAGEPRIELPDGHVLPPDAVIAGLRAAQGADHVAWLGHAAFLIRVNGVTLLTDPFLSEHASPLAPLGPRRFAPPPLRPDQLPPIDVLLLTHNHYDHLDLPVIAAIARRWRPALVTTLGVSRYLDTELFRAAYELDWYQGLELGGVRITATPAIHFSKRTLFDRNATLWCGFFLVGGAQRVLFAGDTAYGSVFDEIGRRLGEIDLALVPIGAYEPRPLMRGSHCTPEEAVAIARALGARRCCGMHWGTIRLTDEPPLEPPARFKAAAAAAGYPSDAVWLLAQGETRMLFQELS
jgi:N-acyl-phosphatidylethanolamine-hydrolysing phospholipase D